MLVLERAPEELRGGNTRFTGGIFRFSYPTLDALESILEGDEDLSDVVLEPYSVEPLPRRPRAPRRGPQRPRADRACSSSARTTPSRGCTRSACAGSSRAPPSRRARPTRGKLGLQLGAAVRTRGKGPALSDTLFARARDARRRGALRRPRRRGCDVDGGARLAASSVRRQGAATIRCGAAVLALRRLRVERGAARPLPRRRVGQRQGARARASTRARCCSRRSRRAPPRRATGASATRRRSAPTRPTSATSTSARRRTGSRIPTASWSTSTATASPTRARTSSSTPTPRWASRSCGSRTALAIQLFDAQATPLLEERYGHTEPFPADTLTALAAELERVYGDRGLTAPTRAARRSTPTTPRVGDGTFDPIALDGLRTNGLAPGQDELGAAARHAARSRAYPVTAGITFTFGGVARRARRAACCAPTAQPIAGCTRRARSPAASSTRTIPAGAGLMRGAVFGRLAGAPPRGSHAPARSGVSA